jgi:hypothetical protein
MKVDLWLSKQKGRKTYMLLASHLEDSSSNTNLNVGILSEI